MKKIALILSFTFLLTTQLTAQSWKYYQDSGFSGVFEKRGKISLWVDCTPSLTKFEIISWKPIPKTSGTGIQFFFATNSTGKMLLQTYGEPRKIRIGNVKAYAYGLMVTDVIEERALTAGQFMEHLKKDNQVLVYYLGSKNLIELTKFSLKGSSAALNKTGC